MSSIRAWVSLTACVATACFAVGCTIGPAVSADPQWGSLYVLSSIDGSTRSSDCSRVGARDLEVAVYEGSTPYTTVIAYCEDFQAIVDLPEGDYDADVTLVDADSRAVSTTARLQGLRVLRTTDLRVEVDFPWSAILP